MKRLRMTAAVALAAVALTAGCDSGPSAPEHQFSAADTTITFSFTDSSVAPEHHRSFVLTIVDGRGTIVVDSYGDETARDEQPVSSDAVEDLLASYNAGELAEAFGPTDPETGCAGGTAVGLTLEDDEATATTSISQCGGANEVAAATLRDAIDPLLQAFDIADLTEGRYAG